MSFLPLKFSKGISNFTPAGVVTLILFILIAATILALIFAVFTYWNYRESLRTQIASEFRGRELLVKDIETITASLRSRSQRFEEAGVIRQYGSLFK